MASGDERIWLDAKIKNKPARVFFDTGSFGPALSQRALQKFNIKVVPAPTNYLAYGVLAVQTERCSLKILGTEFNLSFEVLNVPPYAEQDVDFDGVIGWQHLGLNLLRIDAANQSVTVLKKVPKEIARWTRLPLDTTADRLDLKNIDVEGSESIISIDTGRSEGVALSKQSWKLWKSKHPGAAMTLQCSWSPTDGFLVQEEAWADQITFGQITLLQVPVTSSWPSEPKIHGTNFACTLGMAALSRLDLIVDGKRGVAFLHSKNSTGQPYSHNRLGAVFVPQSGFTNKAIALVAKGSPAYEAGIRDGDVLIQVDTIPVDSWSETWISRFYEPAGTVLTLTLSRGGEIFKSKPNLREILQPAPQKPRS
jgi:hypothetical protein